MNFELADVLKAVGPNASLVFAAWIFLSYLEQRYVASFEQYRDLANQLRGLDDGTRKSMVQRLIGLYRKRCELIRRATAWGVASAMLLIISLLLGALDVILPEHAAVALGGTVTAMIGLLMVIWAASFVVRENAMMREALCDEIKDLALTKQTSG